METLLKGVVRINNFSESAKKYLYIILRAVEGEIWYYGAENNLDRANEIAKAVDGFIVINDDGR